MVGSDQSREAVGMDRFPVTDEMDEYLSMCQRIREDFPEVLPLHPAMSLRALHGLYRTLGNRRAA